MCHPSPLTLLTQYVPFSVPANQQTIFCAEGGNATCSACNLDSQNSFFGAGGSTATV
jgi:hypothetical protein